MQQATTKKNKKQNTIDVILQSKLNNSIENEITE